MARHYNEDILAEFSKLERMISEQVSLIQKDMTVQCENLHNFF